MKPRSREDAKKKTKPPSISCVVLPSRLRAFAVHPPDQHICRVTMQNTIKNPRPAERSKACRPERFAVRVNVPEKFQLIVDCKNEAEQRRAFEWLVASGYLCRVLVL